MSRAARVTSEKARGRRVVYIIAALVVTVFASGFGLAFLHPSPLLAVGLAAAVVLLIFTRIVNLLRRYVT